MNDNTPPLSCCGQITLSKVDVICPFAISNQIFTIYHTPSLLKIHWYLLKLSSENENTDVRWADNSFKNWWNLPISNPKPDPYNIKMHTMFGENPLTFTEVIIQKWKYGCVLGRLFCHLPISNQKPDHHNINAHTKFGENPLMFNSSYHL